MEVKVPSPIVLGFYSFKVTRDSKLVPEGKEASTYFREELIAILPDLSGVQLMQTVVHELKHVIWHLGDVGGESRDEESAVSVLSNLEAELWVRNPGLVEWIHSIVAEP
jgi:hypothetical protein